MTTETPGRLALPAGGNITPIRPGVRVPEAATPQPAPETQAVQGQAEQQQVQPEKPAQKPTQEQIAEAVEKLADRAQSLQRELQFSVDEDSERTIITVINKETGDIVRQIPPEELLNLADHLSDLTSGLVLAAKA